MNLEEYVYSLEERIKALEEKNKIIESYIENKRAGLSTDDLIKKIFDAGPEGIPPSIILRQKNGRKLLSVIAEKKEILLITKHKKTAGKPEKRFIHSSFI